MEDILNNLSKEQQVILKQFRLNLGEYLTPEYSDYNLVKFLRVKNFNLAAAEKIFKVNYYNRITFGMNTILDTYRKPEVAKKYETTGILGFAKDGSLIHYMPSGYLDFYGFIMSMSCLDLCHYFSHMMDLDIKMMKDESLRTGKEIHETTFIFDLEGFEIQNVLHQSVAEMGMDYIRIVQETYPELWSQVLIVNAPKIFDKAFNLFKPILSRATLLEKIKVVDKGSTKALLLKYIDKDVLPAFLGGTRVDSNGDPKCSEFITFGGKVPENLYSRNYRIPLSLNDPDVKCFTVGRRSVHNLLVSVPKAHTKIRFQLRSESGSIHFTLFYREFDPDSDQSPPGENEYLDENSEDFKFKRISVDIRAQAHCTQEDAIVTVEWPGLYIIHLSNANNWFTSRKLMTKIEIFPPKEVTEP